MHPLREGPSSRSLGHLIVLVLEEAHLVLLQPLSITHRRVIAETQAWPHPDLRPPIFRCEISSHMCFCYVGLGPHRSWGKASTMLSKLQN